MNSITRRTVTMLIAAPAVAAAVFAGAAPASAETGGTTCTGMAMPQTSAKGASAPSMMTRAGQVGMLAPATGSTVDMTAGCSTAGHS